MELVSPEEYKKMAESSAPKTNSFRNFAGAFIIGGSICALGEGITNFYKSLGLSSPDSAVLCSVTLIFLSALLTGLGVYDKLAKFGGGGTLVPITGFANAVVAPAMEYKSEGWVLGIGAKMFSVSGPVIVYGLAASVIYGVIYYFVI